MIKFETSLKSIFIRNLKDTTLNTLKNVKQPIFNKDLTKYMIMENPG